LSEQSSKPPIDSIKALRNRVMHSSSQLSIQVSELHADEKGRLEISCVSTIPSKVGRGEQFADFKSYSIKSEYQQLGSLIFHG
jgi:hypothetical protein